MLKVEDLLQNNTSIFLSNNDPGTGTIHTGYLPGGTTVIQRLCSADLAAPTRLRLDRPGHRHFLRHHGPHLPDRRGIRRHRHVRRRRRQPRPEATVHFGRQWNMILTDDPNIPGDDARTAYEMPHCGLFAWENNLANPLSQRITITAGMDDTTPGQVYFWVGEKQTTGNVVERAGLVAPRAASATSTSSRSTA